MQNIIYILIDKTAFRSFACKTQHQKLSEPMSLPVEETTTFSYEKRATPHTHYHYNKAEGLANERSGN
jgi:hypothetical protein